MSRGRELRVVALPADLTGTRAPILWGIALLLTIEAVVFATLVSAYLYLRFHSPEWPPNATAPPDIFPALLAIPALGASSGAVEMGRSALRAERPSTARFSFAAASFFCWIFLLLLAIERVGAPDRWDVDAYGSVVWTTLILYGVHVLVLGLTGAMLARLVHIGELRADPPRAHDPLLLFWHCVTAAWVPVFFLIYLFPRLVAS
jgi:heme/copper-type cytochrome/quinol oxidase subunit 3